MPFIFKELSCRAAHVLERDCVKYACDHVVSAARDKLF